MTPDTPLDDFWDEWHVAAIAASVHPRIATAGRAVLRDHAQRGLGAVLLGLHQDMPLMLELAAQTPATAFYTFLSHVGPGPHRAGLDLALLETAEIFGGVKRAQSMLAQEREAAQKVWTKHRRQAPNLSMPDLESE